jgi:hypothetical protein
VKRFRPKFTDKTYKLPFTNCKYRVLGLFSATKFENWVQIRHSIIVYCMFWLQFVYNLNTYPKT